jgi:hypothetical protein
MSVADAEQTDEKSRPAFPTRRALIGAGAISGIVWTLSYRPAPDPAWIPVKSASPWSARDGAGLIVYNNRLWLTGGSAPKVIDLGDSWSTSDGITWHKEIEQSSWTQAAQSMNVAFAGRMWRMGGFIEEETKFHPINEIWSSADGQNWALVEPSPPWRPRAGGTLVVFREKLWLLGGASQYDKLLFNDVWSTENGVDWTSVNSQAPWKPRAFHTAVAHDGRLWVMGGGNWSKDPTLYGDVWSTPDGINWKQHTDQAAWQGRVWATAASYAGLLWIMGGFIGSPRGGTNDIWYSRDGRHWLPYLSATPKWAPRLAQSAVVFEHRLWITAGSNGDYYNDVWYLDLGGHWSGYTAFKRILASIPHPVDFIRSLFL